MEFIIIIFYGQRRRDTDRDTDTDMDMDVDTSEEWDTNTEHKSESTIKFIYARRWCSLLMGFLWSRSGSHCGRVFGFHFSCWTVFFLHL